MAEIGTARDYRHQELAGEAESAHILWLGRLWSERRFLLRAGLFGIVLSLVTSFLLPVRYESQTRLMPPGQQGGGANLAMLAAFATKGGGRSSNESSSDSESQPGVELPGNLGTIATDFLGLKTSGALVVDILSGVTVQDSLIQKFDLRKIYHDHYWEDARKDLDEHTKIKEDRKSGVISLVVSDRDPHRAQEMATAYVDALNSLLAQVSTSSARRERIFLEQRLKTAKQSLDTAAQEYSNYASKTGALNVPSQAKAMVESEAALQGQLAASESELRGLEEIYTDSNVQVRTLRARISELKQQIENLSGNRGDPNSQSQIAGDLPSLRKLPLVGVRWANLYRESKIQAALYAMLTEEYETAKIQEAKETPTINVLDAALLPERKSFPPRTIITVVGGFLSVFFAGVLVLIAAKWQRSESAEKHLAAEIWGQITSEAAGSRNVMQQAWNRFGGRNGAHNAYH